MQIEQGCKHTQSSKHTHTCTTTVWMKCARRARHTHMHQVGERVCSQVLEARTHTRVRNMVCRFARLRTHTQDGRCICAQAFMRGSTHKHTQGTHTTRKRESTPVCSKCVHTHTQACIRTGERRHACMSRTVGLLRRLAGGSRLRPRRGQPRRQNTGAEPRGCTHRRQPRPGAPFGCRIRARHRGGHVRVSSLPEQQPVQGRTLNWQVGDRE